jgi:RNA polymerase sigma-70 factor (family 1)
VKRLRTQCMTGNQAVLSPQGVTIALARQICFCATLSSAVQRIGQFGKDDRARLSAGRGVGRFGGVYDALMPSGPMDETLPDALTAGSPDSYQQQFMAYAEPLRQYAARFVRSREAAEDLVQDAFWRLWRVWPRLAPDTNVRAYLYTAVRHHALNHLRRARVEARGLAYVTPPPFSERPILPSDAEAQIAADETTAAVERVIAGLSHRQRQIAWMRLRDQLSSTDIAAQLGISPRTVEGHVTHLTRTLREQLPLLLD